MKRACTAIAVLLSLSLPSPALRAGFYVTTLSGAGVSYDENAANSYSDRNGMASYYSSTTGSSTASGTIDTTGRLTSSFDTTAATGDGEGKVYVVPGLQAAGGAFANLADATLNVQAFNNGLSYQPLANGYYAGGNANGSAEFADTLHFSVAGATSSTVTLIPVFYKVAGTLADTNPNDVPTDHQVQVVSYLAFGGAGSLASIYTDVEAMYQQQPAITQDSIFGFGAGSGFSVANPNDIEFAGTIAIHGTGADIPIDQSLYTWTQNGAIVDITSSVNFALPAGVSLTSDSGVFLTAVPEPSTLALLGAGVAGVVVLMRRRPVGAAAG
jgi:hypothetical protein